MWGLDHRSGHGSGQDLRKSGWKFIKSMIFKVFPLLRGLYRDAERNLLAETMIMALWLLPARWVKNDGFSCFTFSCGPARICGTPGQHMHRQGGC
jgi:hypothetical protein